MYALNLPYSPFSQGGLRFSSLHMNQGLILYFPRNLFESSHPGNFIVKNILHEYRQNNDAQIPYPVITYSRELY